MFYSQIKLYCNKSIKVKPVFVKEQVLLILNQNSISISLKSIILDQKTKTLFICLIYLTYLKVVHILCYSTTAFLRINLKTFEIMYN